YSGHIRPSRAQFALTRDCGVARSSPAEHETPDKSAVAQTSWSLQTFVGRRSLLRNCAKAAWVRFSPPGANAGQRRQANTRWLLIARTRDPFERSTRACEQISCSVSVTSISVVGRHSNVLGISPGQMAHADPSLSSPIWLLSCFLICIADLRAIESERCMYQGRCIRGAQMPAIRRECSSDYSAEGRMR